MPNHCEHDLYLSGPDEDVSALLAFIGAADEKPQFDFNRILPYPEPYATMDAEREAIPDLVGLYKDDPEYPARKAAREAAQAAYRAKWGTDSDGYNVGGHEWCIQAWGTKWGAYDVQRRDYRRHTILTFRTAWSPPSDQIFSELQKKFPTVSLELEYFERGMGYCGGAEWPAEDDYYEDDKPWEAGIKVREWQIEGYRGTRGG